MDHRVKTRILFAGLALLLAVLAGCGGGDASSSSSSGSTTNPLPPLTFDRIEPLDTALLKSAAAPAPAGQPVAAASLLPVTAQIARVDLGPLVTTKRAASGGPGAPLQIGVARDVLVTATPDALAQKLTWYTLADGSRAAAIRFSATGAHALRLGLAVSQLPAGAWLRFSGADGAAPVDVSAARIAAIQRLNASGGTQAGSAHLYWGPEVKGDLTTLEIHVPAGAATDQVRLAVPMVSHLTQTALQADLRDAGPPEIGTAGACEVNVMCSPQVDSESRSVARLEFTSAGATFLCTGTLLNDKPGDQTPYLLTASHCIADQPTASSLITYWFFRAASCASPTQMAANAVSQNGGANLLTVIANTDTTLLRLRQQPPAGVVYAGSYFGGIVNTGTAVFDVHNPSGDLQKVSFGSLIDYFTCPAGDGACDSSDASNATSYEVRWSQGVTEPGSSGSALFTTLGSTSYVVGDLHGGSSSCQNPQGSDFFGRFDRSFSAGIRSWLVPQ